MPDSQHNDTAPQAVSHFDSDFEKYIIFHRGVKEVKFNDQDVLCVYYQDDTCQELGDPIGPTWRAKIRTVSDAADNITTTQNNVAASLASAQSLVNSIDNIEGLAKNDSNNKYYVNFSAISGVEKVNGVYKVVARDEINNIIAAIDGIDADANGFHVSSKDAMEQTEELVQEVEGINYDKNTGKYNIAFDEVGGIVKDSGNYKFDVDYIGDKLRPSSIKAVK